jgi:hypothetical protein
MGKRLVNTPNDITQVVGTPDDWDKKNIETLINTFKKTVFPITLPSTNEMAPHLRGKVVRISGAQWIKEVVTGARKYHDQAAKQSLADTNNKYNLKSKDSELRAVCAIPIPLELKLREGYPTLLQGKHLRWFLVNFPEFRTSREKFVI